MKTEATGSTVDQRSENDHNENIVNQNPITDIELVEPSPVVVNAVNIQDVPPNGGYGWVCTVCVFLINANTWGINSVSTVRPGNTERSHLQAWGIFLAHYLQNSTFPGTTQFEYALIGGLSISQACFVAPVVSASMRHFGTNITLLIGTGFVTASMLGASFAKEIWQLFLSQGVCFGFGLGFTYTPMASVLPQWFSTRRSLAVGIASSGAGVGGVAYNLIAGAAAQSIGLNWTYRVLAICSLVFNGICSILIRDRNKMVKPKLNMFDWREFGHTEVVLVIIWGFLTELGYVVLLFSLPHYATTIGLTQSQGAVAGALLNVGLGGGRPLVGYLSDRYGRINMAAFMTASCGICCLALWVPAQNYALLLVFALLAGFGCGTFWGTVSSVAAEVVGLQRLPTVFGVMMITLSAPTTFAEPIGLELVAASGFKSTQIFVGFMYIIAGSTVWLLRSWKIAEIEEKARAEEEGSFVSSLSRYHTGFGLFAPRRLMKVCRV